MADLTTTPILSVYTTVGSKVSDVAVKDGQLIFVRDKQKIILDFDGKRTFYEQIIELPTEAARTSILAPVSGSYYFVLDPGVLWTYRSGWVQITTPPKDTSAFPLDNRCYFTSLALAKAAAASAGEFGKSTTYYCFGQKLLVDDGVFAKWYTIQRNGTLMEEGDSSNLVIASVNDNVLVVDKLPNASVISTDETLTFGTDGVLRVNTTDTAAINNTLPITSAGVYAQLGNIGALLESI